MSSLITLSKGDKDFNSYLDGTFSKSFRALPLQTLNVNSAAETITFKVVPLSEIAQPSIFEKCFQVYKLRSFFLILLPMLMILTKNHEDGSLRDPISALIAAIGTVLSFLAVNLRNDYMDHTKGVDRILERSGSRAIQNGWITAAQVKSASTVFLLLAILTSIPLMWAYPSLILVIALSLGIGLWAQFKKSNSFKYRIGGELALFFMLGPLLTVGLQICMGARVDLESVCIGALWGWLVLFVVHLRNFMNIFMSGQAGFTNTVNWLGFDKSRRLIVFWWLSFIILNLAYHLVFAGTFWGPYLTLVLFICSFSFLTKVRKIASPIGGDMRALFRSGFNLFLLTVGMITFECIWYLAR